MTSSMDLAVLIHTMDRYSFLWPGTERIRALEPRICMLRTDWYNEVCRKGRLTAAGEAMMARINPAATAEALHPSHVPAGKPCVSDLPSGGGQAGKRAAP